MRVLRFLGIATLLTMIASSCSAQTRYGSFTIDRASPQVALLQGPIDLETGADFRQLLRDHPGVEVLMLDSGGGSVVAGLEVAETVDYLGMATFVPQGADCASACAFILFAGTPRLVEGGLGVHQFTTSNSSRDSISATERRTQGDAAAIIDALNRFDTPSTVLVRMLETPPEDMYWFTFRELLEMGLVGLDQDANPAPVVPQTVTPPKVPQVASAPRPSFNCSRASTASEFAICGSHVLSDLDRQMAARYNAVRTSMTASQQDQLRRTQREWLRAVASCGAEAGCIETQYRHRIGQLGR